MTSKKRTRIHPAVACTAVVALAAMSVAMKVVTGEPNLEFELIIAGAIGALAGIKLRVKLPVT